MICIIALIVFGVMAIFSAKYRPVAKEALDCVLRRVTFRKCESRLDVRLKGQITGKLMKSHPKVAKFIYKRFEIISWIMLAIMIWSIISSGIAVYNYAMYGNCNGKQNGEAFCVFDPAGKSSFSTAITNYSGPVVLPSFGNNYFIGPRDAKVEIIEFGCYRCPYTKKAEATVKQILKNYNGKVVYTYRDFPLSDRHFDAELHALAARCAGDQEKYWEFRDYLFEKFDNMTHDENGLKQLGSDFGFNTTQFNECFDSKKYMPQIEEDVKAGIMAGVYGTPTFFINNKTIVGPQEYGMFKLIIDKALKQ